MRTPRSHPLEAIVLDIMREHGAMDASKLAPLLGGSFALESRHYKRVAQDVLDVLLKKGKTYKDCVGWHYAKPVVEVAQ